ncbi:hypothetical protein [Paucibacter sp. DJ2R-2]|uniref:hypothetical protein n=1 Tax=Paucibacter sp. DJ2R-2 TaxID=2893558 RepID=UPI0021E47A0E|nr:hypothetical protein [Paucibacter sp. DJ2R-2]MCV2439272.1 hypothetical protein [Paucibacter sp. DJ2R-2]
MTTRNINSLDQFLDLAATHIAVEQSTQVAEQELATLSTQEQDRLFQRMWAATVSTAEAIRAEEKQSAAAEQLQTHDSQSMAEVAIALGRLFSGLAYHVGAKLDELIRPAPRPEFSRLTLGASSLPSEKAELDIKFANGIVCRPDMAFPRQPGDKPLGWLFKCPDDGKVPDGQGGMCDARSCEWRLVFRCGDQWIDGPVIGSFDANGEIEVPFTDNAVFSVDLVPVAVEPLDAST